MPTTATETEAKRAATMAATWRQVQGGAATLAWKRQAHEEEAKATEVTETDDIATQLEIQRNQTRMAIASSEGASPAAEEQKKQEPTALERLKQRPMAMVLQNVIRSSLTGVGLLIAIPYANFHAIMHGVGVKYFCALGEEWTFTSALDAKAPPISPGIIKLFGWLELLILVALDITGLINLFQYFALTAVVVSAVIHPWDTFVMLGFTPLKLLWDSIQG